MIYTIFMILQVAAILYFAAKNITKKPIIIGAKCNKLNEKPRSEILWLCIISCIYLFVIAGGRSASVGYDSGQYRRRFLEIAGMTWGEVFKIYKINNEPFFYWLCKLISVISNNPQMLFIITGLIYSFAIGYFIYNNSQNPAISFLMLFPMQFYSFLLTGMRQALAFSVIVIFYTKSKKKNRKSSFLIGVLIAYLFHNSSVAALPMICFSDKNVSSIERVIWFILLPFVYIFGAKILNFLKIFLYSDYEVSSMAVGTLLTMIMYFAIWGLYFLFIGTRKIKDRGENQVERFLMLGIMLQLLVAYQPNFFRIAMLYQIFSVLAVPKIIETQKGEGKFAILLGFIFVIFLLFFKFTFTSCGINPFKFFWE